MLLTRRSLPRKTKITRRHWTDSILFVASFVNMYSASLSF